MSAKTFIAFASQGAAVMALGLAAAAATAQAVPQELWVGPPISTTGGTMTRAQVTADLAQDRLTASAAPQQLRVGPADPPVGAVSRAEVVADLNLWQRAGIPVARDGYRAYYDPRNTQAAQRLALYQSMRNGDAYAEEVARLRERGAPVLTSASAELADDAK